MDKIDAHIHVNTEESVFLEAAGEHGFRLLTINTDVSTYPPITTQRDFALHHMRRFPGRIAFAATFRVEGWDDPGWEAETIAYLEDCIARGAVAVKVWKNIGMEIRDESGGFVQIDDPRFDSIFDFLAEKGIPLVGHIGEPRNCWLTVEEMTVNNDKAYFASHPRYHMALHPEYPSYETILTARDRMLEKHPDLKFIGCHLGSLEWSVDALAERLDRYPNLAVDFAARMSHLQYQSKLDRKKVRDFLIRYRDRLIYGTDMGTDHADDSESLRRLMHETWTRDWAYLATDAVMTSPDVDGSFRGLELPRKVIECIYRRNAETWYPGLTKTR